MNNYYKEFLNSIISLHRYSKRLIAIIIDLGFCILCTWLAFFLRLDEIILLKDFNFYPAIISMIIAIPTFWLFGVYRAIFRYTGLSIIFTIIFSIIVYGFLYFLAIGVYGATNVPRSIGILQPMLLFFFMISSRLLIKYFLLQDNYFNNKNNNKKNVLIYGAGEAGRQLLNALEGNPKFKVLGFLDDNINLHKQIVLGQKIYSLFNLEKLVIKKKVSLVFLALPSINSNKRNSIIENLNKHNLIIKTLPSISEIVDGKINLSDIKDLYVEDLLNREKIEPDVKLLNKNINLKIVLVTGAGGSIGSELCRQILRLKPKKLLILELNEFALYKINDELRQFNQDVKIIPLLVNTQDQAKLEIIFDTFKVNTVYHAAAYKHVPLVEENICEGVKNNVFSTLAIIKASILKKVSNLVLISSDKAVRPTNIMGASKRVAEICMQSIYHNTKNIKTSFSIVRFGNVLESSGSVIPKFKKQINEGGPVTLTHKDVTRYFMTINEASELVIQAGAMGKHSEVFVLDMGKSVRIIDLITKMINLSGFSVKDINNPTGDIEIKVIGLRAGEKLYEELLIGDNPERTNHPKIKKINDPFIPFDQLEKNLKKLKSLLDNNKVAEVKDLLNKFVKLYKSSSNIVDHIYLEKKLIAQSNEKILLDKGSVAKVVKLNKNF